jgi:hypothetical protein
LERRETTTQRQRERQREATPRQTRQIEREVVLVRRRIRATAAEQEELATTN